MKSLMINTGAGVSFAWWFPGSDKEMVKVEGKDVSSVSALIYFLVT